MIASDELDYISILPNECLLEIAKHLTRLDIHNTCLANKRLRPIAYNRLLDKIKWRGGDLFLYQTSRGYGFYFIVNCDEYPIHYWPASYIYETWKNDSGEITEMRATNENYSVKNDINDHGMPIPNDFFASLYGLLRLHGITSMQIVDIPFGSPKLFTRLSAVLDDQHICVLICERMRCHEISNETKKSFAQLIRRIPKVDLRDSKEVPTLISEEFLSDIAESELREYYDPHDEPHVSVGMPLLSRLTHIDKLEAHTIFLDANVITNFCMLYMDARALLTSHHGWWMFAVDQEVTEQIIRQNLRDADYEYEDYAYNYKFDYYIIRKADGLKACIFHDVREGSDGRTYFTMECSSLVENSNIFDTLTIDQLMDNVFYNRGRSIDVNEDHDGSSLLNNSERNGHDDPMQNMVNADELDHISSLPDDCLLEIAKHLTRMDIYNMCLANKRMRSIAHNPCLDKIKWRGTWEGYGFHYAVTCDDYPPERSISYLYETWQDMDGDMDEMRVTDTLPDEEDFNEHGWLIPDELFAALSTLLRHHALTILNIQDIPFDCPLLFERLDATLKHQQITLIDCDKMRCHALQNDTRKSFAQFIKRVREVDLRDAEAVPSLISEEFLLDIANSNLKEYREPHSGPQVRLNTKILPRLMTINTLEARGVTLDVNLVPLFCMMYIDARAINSSEIGYWIFSVDRPVTYQILKRGIRAEDYEYKDYAENDNDWSRDYDHFIIRKVDGMTACFNRYDSTWNRDNPLCVAVEFKKRR